MILVTGVLYPGGTSTGSDPVEILHGTITNTSPEGIALTGESYAVHMLQRPSKRHGIVGFECDAEVREFHPRLGLAPLLSAVLSAMDPVPFDFEPVVDIQGRLLLEEMDAFDARLRGQR